MNPGKLDERVILSYPFSSSVDFAGVTHTTYATSSIWAQVKMFSGDEIDNGGFITTFTSYGFRVRNNSTITEKCSIIYDGNTYNIKFINSQDNKGYINLTTERRN